MRWLVLALLLTACTAPVFTGTPDLIQLQQINRNLDGIFWVLLLILIFK